MLNSQASHEVAPICRFVTGHSRVHVEPTLLPGHMWRESPHPQKATTIATEPAQYLFPYSTTTSIYISQAWKSEYHYPLWSRVLLYHRYLVFLCRQRRLKGWPSSPPLIHCLQEPETPTAEAKVILEIQPNWTVLLQRNKLLKLLYM